MLKYLSIKDYLTVLEKQSFPAEKAEALIDNVTDFFKSVTDFSDFKLELIETSYYDVTVFSYKGNLFSYHYYNDCNCLAIRRNIGKDFTKFDLVVGSGRALILEPYAFNKEKTHFKKEGDYSDVIEKTKTIIAHLNKKHEAFRQEYNKRLIGLTTEQKVGQICREIGLKLKDGGFYKVYGWCGAPSLANLTVRENGEWYYGNHHEQDFHISLSVSQSQYPKVLYSSDLNDQAIAYKKRLIAKPARKMSNADFYKKFWQLQAELKLVYWD
jgi:hypothetical protein